MRRVMRETSAKWIAKQVRSGLRGAGCGVNVRNKREEDARSRVRSGLRGAGCGVNVRNKCGVDCETSTEWIAKQVRSGLRGAGCGVNVRNKHEEDAPT